ncbi:MAG TPA: hypothetical protein VFE53_07325 [Mucilaginibacter sp.]|nr:hypothetical protein [Mucilaginibacter sp.]
MDQEKDRLLCYKTGIEIITKDTTGQYNGQEIFAQESMREAVMKKQSQIYTSEFVEQPHFELKFKKMGISFQYKNLMPPAGIGTVYPHLRVVDNWGILTVDKGALLSSDWTKVNVSIPLTITKEKIAGDGWTLELNSNYTIRKDIFDNNFYVTKMN